ncbi:putative RNA-directed DNA polymerase from transposon BS [Araneus ventricosus]|uniref:Putative RNA-directed DNA polymerase from transposon BS n=1 Tax=Araneus ventricosus TaxID=182803 RepID=A0A4Y2DGK0_ARAVE|nr:putative RNA-directed DNA polymerase from transposon BS [Araneus ventricosus]
MDVFRQAIDTLVSDIALFGICPIDKCNISEIKYKKNFEEKFNNGSNCSKSVIDSSNIMNDSSCIIKVDSINVESVNEFSGTVAVDNFVLNDVFNDKTKGNATHNNSRKRTASSGPVYSSSRIRVDKEMGIYTLVKRIRFHYQNDNINSIQTSDVIKIIRKLNIKKACGRDGITYKMIKNIPCTMVFALTEIINNIFNFNYFPNAWKTAVVVPILKPGKDPTIPENYRPISLLSTLSKITENFVLDKLNEHLIGNKILCPEQFGFRKSLTTKHQLLRVVEYITKGFDRSECTAAVFLDIQKASDRVLKQGLIHKLIMYKNPAQFSPAFKLLSG